MVFLVPNPITYSDLSWKVTGHIIDLTLVYGHTKQNSSCTFFHSFILINIETVKVELNMSIRFPVATPVS